MVISPDFCSANRRRVSVLGSTGSVGSKTVGLLMSDPGAYHVVALTAHRNIALLESQVHALNPDIVVTADPSLYGVLKERLAGIPTEVAAGPEAVIEAASRPADWVMSCMVGATGLQPTLAAVRQAGVVALANKESLVCAGPLVMREAQRYGCTIVPVDSEHSAIFQVLTANHRRFLDKIILTASGGPFWKWTRQDMQDATPQQAINHPNWSMGAKISVDSASMMNKGLELIEACHLFDLSDDQVDVLIHRESIVHSMVAYCDGSVLAQMGVPDMSAPISFALAWPQRMATSVPPLDLTQVQSLTFEAPDVQRFPALSLARSALKGGGGLPIVFNAANEVAVAHFLDSKIRFVDIARVVEQTMERSSFCAPVTLPDILDIDLAARDVARALCIAVHGVKSVSGVV